MKKSTKLLKNKMMYGRSSLVCNAKKQGTRMYVGTLLIEV